jgi:hypothetical protein
VRSNPVTRTQIRRIIAIVPLSPIHLVMGFSACLSISAPLSTNIIQTLTSQQDDFTVRWDIDSTMEPVLKDIAVINYLGI